MNPLKLNFKFIYFLIIIFTIQFLLVLIAAGMFIDGAGNYQDEGSIILGILRYVLGFPLYWFIDASNILDKFDFFILIIFLVNTYIQWVIYQTIKMKI